MFGKKQIHLSERLCQGVFVVVLLIFIVKLCFELSTVCALGSKSRIKDHHLTLKWCPGRLENKTYSGTKNEGAWGCLWGVLPTKKNSSPWLSIQILRIGRRIYADFVAMESEVFETTGWKLKISASGQGGQPIFEFNVTFRGCHHCSYFKTQGTDWLFFKPFNQLLTSPATKTNQKAPENRRPAETHKGFPL